MLRFLMESEAREAVEAAWIPPGRPGPLVADAPGSAYLSSSPPSFYDTEFSLLNLTSLSASYSFCELCRDRLLAMSLLLSALIVLRL